MIAESGSPDEEIQFQSVYEELRRLAAAKLARESPGQTLDATGLVHEAWIALQQADLQWQSKSHFLRTSATAMRRLLVDRARSKKTAKRSRRRKETAVDPAVPCPEDKVLELDAALTELSEQKPDHAQLLEHRYFGGMTVNESAEAMQISPSTADRMLRYAKAWLQVELGQN